MSQDMSMFKKVKERIADEVNSATNKLQNMQIIDQLASSINQQNNSENNSIPNQTLPHPSEFVENSNRMPNNNRYNLVDDEPLVGNYGEEDELNSEISPQHQLFNEQSIKRIGSPDKTRGDNNAEMSSNTNNKQTTQNMYKISQEQSVIDVQEISSDLEDDPNLRDDIEIDLLSDERALDNDRSVEIDSTTNHNMTTYKARYRNVVHTLRKLNQDHIGVKTKLEAHVNELSDQLAGLRTELQNVKQSSESLLGVSGATSDNDKMSGSSSPKPGGKHGGKIKDLEKLIAKCKESLKLKNSQLKSLKESLGKHDLFKESIDELKSDLQLLRNAHETWTVSIAENKRVMHQEMEAKNAEMDKLKLDIRDLQTQVKEGNSKVSQHKQVIQNLESRLVSTSAAHQKERESLIKELTAAKNNAIKQVQKEHELQLERVKLDLEKSIESLKSELLTKDEQIIRSAEQYQQERKQNETLAAELEESKGKLDENLKIFGELRASYDQNMKESTDLRAKIGEYEAKLSDKSSSGELEKQIEEMNQKLALINKERDELKHELDQSREENMKPCQECEELRKQLSTDAESYKQSMFDLNARLDLMTTANADQERALNAIKSERDVANDTLRATKLEMDELIKKNESLTRVIKDHETEMQNQQEQLDGLEANRQELEHLKKENSSLLASLQQLRLELNERTAELGQSREEIEQLRLNSSQQEAKMVELAKNIDDLAKERDTLIASGVSEAKSREDLEQQLVVTILTAMKNLETPNTSPGRDKGGVFEATKQQTQSTDPDHHSSLNNQDRHCSNLVALAERLSSLAVDRCQAYMTANQRLQTVLLENSMISEELHRLRDELNTVSKEKTQETLNSIDESERLRTENQALIHDQKTYDDRIASLEGELEALGQQLASEKAKVAVVSSTSDVSTETTARFESDDSEIEARDNEIEELRKIVIDREQHIQTLRASIESKEAQTVATGGQVASGPDSTEFEYLKNIVYQFMLGREPLVLARVISAIFKFDNEQVEHICRVQEAVQSVIRPNS